MSDIVESDSEAWNVVTSGRKGNNRNRSSRADMEHMAGNGGDQQRKRMRRSTGGTSQSAIQGSKSSVTYLMSVDEFKSMSTDDKLVAMFSAIQKLGISEQKLGQVEKSVTQNTRNISQTIDRVKLLEYRSIDQEARNRRNNLIFRGIPEVVGENCAQIISEFITEQLQITQSICIQRAHRLGRKQYGNSGRGLRPFHRPVIVALRDYQEVEHIISKTKILAGTRFGVSRDYPQEIANARKELFPKLKALKMSKPNSKVSIVYPARLIVDNQIVDDKFPDWPEVMRRSRHVTSNAQHRGKSDHVVSQVRSSGNMSVCSSSSDDVNEAVTSRDTGVTPPVNEHLLFSQVASSSFSVENILSDGNTAGNTAIARDESTPQPGPGEQRSKSTTRSKQRMKGDNNNNNG